MYRKSQYELNQSVGVSGECEIAVHQVQQLPCSKEEEERNK